MLLLLLFSDHLCEFCSSSGFQPSVYLRLLENPSSVVQQTSSFSFPEWSDRQSSHSRSPSPLRPTSPLSAPPSPPPPRCFSASASDADLSSDVCEQQVNFSPRLNRVLLCLSLLSLTFDLLLLSPQSKSQKLSAGEYSRRSIKERAVLLSSMFHGSNKPSAALCVSQVVYQTCKHIHT